ncbi:MAG: hypothetical protein ACRD3D_15245 [Terriglobia bacterium]
MAEKRISIVSLIAIPALITLAVTILRLEGELHRWGMPWFHSTAGGGGAIVGIVWLPIIFGPYFALKLAGAGEGPFRMGRAAGFMILGIVIFAGGGFLAFATMAHQSFLTLIGFLLMLVGAVVPRAGWRSLAVALLAYAFAARIPVLVVMYLAMHGNGGAGWGTHYDAAGPAYAHLSLGAKFFYLAVVPQMTLWIGWTVSVGMLLGVIAAAVFPRRHSVPAAA